jgi:hypothetical protein
MSSAIHTSSKPTLERAAARVFGLHGDSWLRHANPVSVWSRFAVLPLLAAAIWSRDWIGWWCLVPIALAVAWLFVNPLVFPAPRSTRNWASRGVLGERIWADRDAVDLPAQFTTTVPNVTMVFSTLGLALWVYGLIELDLLVTAAGIVLQQVSKAWFIDRQVLLFEDMKDDHPEYAAWDF